MRSRLLPLVLFMALIAAVSPVFAGPITVSFSAGDVKSIMLAQGAPLHDSTYQWGLWALRAMPIVQGGGYSMLGGSVSGVPGEYWAFEEPAAYGWAAPYDADVAFFYAKPGSEHLGVDAHPLYMIADQPVDTFQSYAFDNTTPNPNAPARSVFVGVCTSDLPAAGCNQTNLVADTALFSFQFMIDPGARWLGWQFVVDGSKYYRPGLAPAGYGESRWVADFIGGDGDLASSIYGPGADGGAVPENTGDGYQVLMPIPEPATFGLLALGLGAASVLRRRRSR